MKNQNNMRKIFYFIVTLLLLGVWSCTNKSNKTIQIKQEVENTNSSEYYYHIIELFEEQDISTLQQIVEFAEKNKPANEVLKENLNKKGPYSIYFNGKEDFDTVIYGIRYVSNKVN